MLETRQTCPILRIATLEPMRDAEGTAVFEFRSLHLNIRLVVRLVGIEIREISLGGDAFGTALIGAKSEEHAVLARGTSVTWDLVHEAKLARPGSPAVFFVCDISTHAFPAGSILVAIAVFNICRAMAAWWLVIVIGVVEAVADVVGVECRISLKRRQVHPLGRGFSSKRRR